MFTGPIPTGQMPAAPVPPGPAPAPLQVPPSRFPDAPSPLGLAMALVGLLLLCASVLIPRISVTIEQDDEYAYYSVASFYSGDVQGLGAETVVLAVALLTAVGVSAARTPAWRWPSRVAAVGLATFAAAFAYHPVNTIREQLSTLEGYEGEPIDAEVAAESGIYLMIFAVGLLAASTFFMHVTMNRAAYQPPPQAPAPGPGQGPTPTVTVTPG